MGDAWYSAPEESSDRLLAGRHFGMKAVLSQRAADLAVARLAAGRSDDLGSTALAEPVTGHR